MIGKPDYDFVSENRCNCNNDNEGDWKYAKTGNILEQL